MCVQEFVIPRGGVQRFRTNFFINTLKEREATTKTLTSEETVAPCASCGSVDNKVEGYCSSCGGFVCKDCMGVHSRVKLFSDHKVIPYDDLRSGKVDIRNLSQKMYCEVHQGQVLWFYCETCCVLICQTCTVVDHPTGSHNLVNLESATKGQRKEIKQLMKSCEGSKTRAEDAIKRVDNVVDELCRNTQATEAAIDAAYQKAMRLLEVGWSGKKETTGCSEGWNSVSTNKTFDDITDGIWSDTDRIGLWLGTRLFVSENKFDGTSKSETCTHKDTPCSCKLPNLRRIVSWLVWILAPSQHDVTDFKRMGLVFGNWKELSGMTGWALKNWYTGVV